jgi:hypothetical protein
VGPTVDGRQFSFLKGHDMPGVCVGCNDSGMLTFIIANVQETTFRRAAEQGDHLTPGIPQQQSALVLERSEKSHLPAIGVEQSQLRTVVVHPDLQQWTTGLIDHQEGRADAGVLPGLQLLETAFERFDTLLQIHGPLLPGASA